MKPNNFLLFGCCAFVALATAVPSKADTNSYKVINLTCNVKNVAAVQDTNLINPWGMSYSPNGAFWISDNGTGLTTLYDGTGKIIPLVVTVPGVPSGATGSPTGQVFNGSSDFVVGTGSAAGPGIFIFDSEDGTISGWNGSGPAIIAVDRSSTGAVYKGLALVHSIFGNALYATNFNSGMVDVFDAHYTYLGSFTDSTLPSGYAPFGITPVNGMLIVTFAKQNAAKHDNLSAPGLGYVDAFSADGTLIRRIASSGALNAPWGIALAPANFGTFSQALLIGNFGDGHVSAYDFANGDYLGQLEEGGKPFQIPGLWGLMFGNGGGAGPVNTLYYTAGPKDESAGVFGDINAVPSPGAAAHKGE